MVSFLIGEVLEFVEGRDTVEENSDEDNVNVPPNDFEGIFCQFVGRRIFILCIHLYY